MISKRLKSFFKKNKKKKRKYSFRKRKFLGSVGLAWVLLCGCSAKSSNQDHNNYLAHERVISNGLRGGLITPNPSMETVSRQLSQ